MRLKTLALCALTAFSIVGLIGCGNTGTTASSGNSDKKIELKFWHAMGGSGAKGIDELVKRFNDSHPNIHVTAEFQGSYDDTITKLRNAGNGKNLGADVVQVFDLGTRYMIDSGLTVPVQDYLDKDKYDISKIEPNIAAYYTINNKLYSMPFNSSTPLLYYNKDIFKKAGIEKPPTSLEELKAMGPKLVQDGGAQMPLALTIYGWYSEQFFCKSGIPIFDNNNGREKAPGNYIANNNKELEQQLTVWNELAKAGIAPNIGRKGGPDEFNSGKAAMTVASSANLRDTLNQVGGKFEVGTAFYPSVKAGDKGGVSIGGASLWMINSEDKARMDATWEFIKFMISPESQAYWNSMTGYFPITVDAAKESVFKDNMSKFPQFQTAIDQLHASNPQSQGGLSASFAEIRQITEKEIENMLNGAKTPAQAAAAIAEQANAAIKIYNDANGTK
ncbi:MULTISPECIES: ABC transporter substrate-binding protein [Megasphaera]|uniref:ABC transporter, solute-binding protein n=1 Tax=Megasphaera vaginalis (ex Srinivasan et al. 2021) TaxID=1111454 RepID=U7UH18_9FIRM|nr:MULTISPECIES: ABC transporter substrate-binding protein [Megasphaera]ERT58717.1 ABC transporter, solute-binding protein [Megasphaera vaginalis (ex Srinivasan et al. 2021)]